MTKQELEDKFDECFDKNTKPTGGGYEADWTDRQQLYNDFESSILSFAKQQAIELLKWMGNRMGSHIDRYIPVGVEEELYSQFIGNQSKETSNGQDSSKNILV